MRAFWSGAIAFGLVSIPAKLYSATKDLSPQFHQLHTTCGTRVTTVRRCPSCESDVPWEEIGKGYEVSKGQYALFTKEELAKLEGDADSDTIEIAQVLDPAEIDLALVEKSYWVGPGGIVRGYCLLRTVLEEAKRVALARVCLRTRPRLAVLRPRDGIFALDLLRFPEELVAGDELAPAGQTPSAREQKLARAMVKKLVAPFDPRKHPDAYREAVLAAVEEKVDAGELAQDVAQGAPVVDLAELLERSMKRSRRGRRRGAAIAA